MANRNPLENKFKVKHSISICYLMQKSFEVEEDCIACGTCEGICPEVFQVTDRSRVNEGVNFNDYEEGIKEAAESCPVSVIKYD